MIKPVKGYTLCEVKVVEGKGILLHDGTKAGDERRNVVVATNKEDKVDWKAGDIVALPKGAVATDVGDGKFVVTNSAIVAVL